MNHQLLTITTSDQNTSPNIAQGFLPFKSQPPLFTEDARRSGSRGSLKSSRRLPVFCDCTRTKREPGTAMKVEKKKQARTRRGGLRYRKVDVVYRVPGTSYVKGSSPWEHKGEMPPIPRRCRAESVPAGRRRRGTSAMGGERGD